MVHIRKQKGDIAAAVVIADLTKKGYHIFTPTVSEHLPFDMIAYKEGKCCRIQAKYSSTGAVSKGNAWNDKHGTHVKLYDKNDFDYYAIYLATIDKVVYPSIAFAGINIAFEIPHSPTPFWWWEDFTSFTDTAEKKKYFDFGFDLSRNRTDKAIEASMKRRKVIRPSKEELQKLLWEYPTIQLSKRFGISDKAIEKWAKAYGLSKPPRGYWTKQRED